MLIEIHDVDHGGCVVITGPDGHRLMLDCGLSVERRWFPSVSYHGEHIDTLMLLNLDEDHCEDLSYVCQSCSLGAIVSNPTVTATALRAMKQKGGMREGVKKATELLQTFGSGMIGNWSHPLGGVHWHAFWNRYGYDFEDTNNLSLAVFVQFGNFTVLFGGDLERAGWRRLLLSSAFRARLRETNVYVASHHGRENGCCEEIFDFCRPQLIVFSDGPKQYGTQETHGWYFNRAIGIPDFSQPASVLGRQPVRRIMTTRRDGTITIQVSGEGHYLVLPSKGTSSPQAPALQNAVAWPANALARLATGAPYRR